MTQKFTKIEAGWYATADGRYAVILDGFTPGDNDGMPGGEWGACHDREGQLRISHQAGDNLDWFATKREAIDFLTTHKEK